MKINHLWESEVSGVCAINVALFLVDQEVIHAKSTAKVQKDIEGRCKNQS